VGKLLRVALPAAAFLLVLVMAARYSAPGEATFPGENGKIAYERYPGDGPPDIYVANADGTGEVNLTNENSEDITPAWSPDGTRIVFASDRGDQNHRRIFMMNADGSHIVKLTDQSNQFWPAWSPDGSAIIYRYGGNITRMDLSSGQTTTLRSGQGVSSAPDFSPDGHRIAFSDNADGDLEIWVMDADGGNPTQLTFNSGVDDNPSWSADGSKIIFDSDSSGNSDIWQMNPTGGALVALMNDPADDEGPDVSPDGSLIAFYSERDNVPGMYVISSSGADAHLVIPGDVYSFEWQRPMDVHLQGDVNCDGSINAADSGALLASFAGLVPDQEPGCMTIGGPFIASVIPLFGDVDCSGMITPRDALQVLLYYVVLPTTPLNDPCTKIGDALPT
jgi:Tol biopolymer transport system component